MSRRYIEWNIKNMLIGWLISMAITSVVVCVMILLIKWVSP